MILSIVILGPIGQFLLFKFTPVYNLNLLSQLYNDASWVEGKPRIAIMGSSHARYHIIPSEIAKLNKDYDLSDIVNIGENAASPFSQYTSFVKNRNKFTNLDIVYYTIEPHMLGEKYFTYLKHEEIFLDYDQWKYLEANHAKKNNYFFAVDCGKLEQLFYKIFCAILIIIRAVILFFVIILLSKLKMQLLESN